MQKTVKIGKLEITTQAFIVIVIGLVLGVFSSYFMNPLAGLVIIPAFFLSAYQINCMIVGKCIVLTWILIALYILYTMVIISSKAFLIIFKKK